MHPNQPFLLTSFPPLASPDARVLILGSMPGEASLRAGEYYGHPRNAFWPILAGLTGVAAGAAYAERVRGLQEAGFALWDVVGRCRRRGSLDADIEADSVEPNDIAGLVARSAGIRLVACNGGAAFRLYRRWILPALPQMPVVALPSTSPAHAGMSIDDKARQWREALSKHIRR